MASMSLKQVFLGHWGHDRYILETDTGKKIVVHDMDGNGKVDGGIAPHFSDVISGPNCTPYPLSGPACEEIALTDEERHEVVRIVNEYDVVKAAQSYAQSAIPAQLKPFGPSEEYFVCDGLGRKESGPYNTTSLHSGMFRIDDLNENGKPDYVQFEADGVTVVAQRNHEMIKIPGFGWRNCLILNRQPSDAALLVLGAFSFVFER